jgi:hypothetical protein
MPKAAMHKYDLFAARKHYIGLSRQFLRVEPVSVSIGKKMLPDGLFWLRIFRPYSSHDAAAGF